MNYNEKLDENIVKMSKGAFLTTKFEDEIDTMTIGWGSVGYMWRRPVFMVMVRTSRYTHELIEKSMEFTVSIPSGDMEEVLKYCGNTSLRDENKIEKMNLSLLNVNLDTPILNIKGTHYECRVVYKTDMDKKNLDSEIDKSCYNRNEYHTMYFGEIINVKEI